MVHIQSNTYETSLTAPTGRMRSRTATRWWFGLACVIFAFAVGPRTLAMARESRATGAEDAQGMAVPAWVPGVVSRIVVADHQVVQKGDVLARLDAELAEAHLALADAEFSSAKAAEREATADARLATTGGPLGELALERTRAHEAVAEARLLAARTALDLAALELWHTRILAPRDGVVSKILVAEGEGVTPGQATVRLMPSKPGPQ